jgi:hypothetical protein
MAKLLYRELSSPYSSVKTAYNGCSTTACKGEQVRDFDKCIVHLDDAQADQHAIALREGEGFLNFSNLEVDADFVKQWVDRIAIDVDGRKHVPVQIAMQQTRMVDGLAFGQHDFPKGLSLQSLSAHVVQIGEGIIAGGLNLDSAVIEDEISLQQLKVDRLSMVGAQAKIAWVLNCPIEGLLDARSLKLKSGLHLRGSEIGAQAQFRDSKLGDPNTNVTVSAQFHALADFSNCIFPAETQFGRYGDLPPSTFTGPATFDGSTFGTEEFGAALFKECSFQATASFKHIEAYGALSLVAARFEGSADLSNVYVRSAPFSQGKDPSHYPTAAFDLSNAVLQADLNLTANIEGTAHIQNVSFASLSEGLVLSAAEELTIERVSFEQFSVLELSSTLQLTLDQLQLRSGGRLRLDAPTAHITNFACARPAVVSGTRSQDGDRTKLVSLDGSDPIPRVADVLIFTLRC